VDLGLSPKSLSGRVAGPCIYIGLPSFLRSRGEKEGTKTQATDLASRFARLRAKFEEGSGAGSTKHPMTESEEKAFKSAVAGAGSTEHPKTEGEEKKPYKVVLGFARVRDDPELPGGLSITLDMKYMYVYAVLGSGLNKRSTTKAAKPAGPGRRGRSW
jgi:hypothetical protein